MEIVPTASAQSGCLLTCPVAAEGVPVPTEITKLAVTEVQPEAVFFATRL